jgi:hypothetical protein
MQPETYRQIYERLELQRQCRRFVENATRTLARQESPVHPTYDREGAAWAQGRINIIIESNGYIGFAARKP